MYFLRVKTFIVTTSEEDNIQTSQSIYFGIGMIDRLFTPDRPPGLLWTWSTTRDWGVLQGTEDATEHPGGAAYLLSKC